MARAGAPKAGHTLASSKAAVPYEPPYTAAEILALRGCLPALEREDRLHLLGAMALGFGCGVCGAEAADVEAATLLRRAVARD